MDNPLDKQEGHRKKLKYGHFTEIVFALIFIPALVKTIVSKSTIILFVKLFKGTVTNHWRITGKILVIAGFVCLALSINFRLQRRFFYDYVQVDGVITDMRAVQSDSRPFYSIWISYVDPAGDAHVRGATLPYTTPLGVGDVILVQIASHDYAQLFSEAKQSASFRSILLFIAFLVSHIVGLGYMNYKP